VKPNDTLAIWMDVRSRDSRQTGMMVDRQNAMTDSLDDKIIETAEGPMTWAAWKKKNPVQRPSRRTKGKDLPNKVRRSTDET
jgi:hypothetical protein